MKKYQVQIGYNKILYFNDLETAILFEAVYRQKTGIFLAIEEIKTKGGEK